MFGGGHDHTIEGRRFLKTMTPKKPAVDYSSRPTQPHPWQMPCHRVAPVLIKVWTTTLSWEERRGRLEKGGS